MKKFLISVASMISIFSLSGCAPQQQNSAYPTMPTYYKQKFRPDIKRIVYVEGKPFAVPKQAEYSPYLMTASYAKKYSLVGVPCKAGELLWTYDADNMLKNNDMLNYIKKGYLGCAHPLNHQEYQYWLHEQREREKLEKYITRYG